MSNIPQYQSNPGRAPVPPTSGMAVASLILGICSLVFFCMWKLALPAAVLAIVLGFMARSQFAAGQGGRGMAIAGIVLGFISLLLVVVLIAGVLSLIHFGVPALQRAQQQMMQQVQQYQQIHNQTNPTTSPG